MPTPPPLPGDPGYALDKYKKGGLKPPEPKSGRPSPEEMEDVSNDIEGIMAEMGISPGGEGGDEMLDTGMPGSAEGGEMPPEGGGGDAGQVLADVLGVSPEHGQALYDAAQENMNTQGMSPEELAQALDEDYQLRKELERMVAERQDTEAMAMSDDMGDMGGPPGGPGGDEEEMI